MKRRLIAYTHGSDDPAGRFRIAQYAALLGEADWDVSLRPRSPARPWKSRHPRAAVWLRRLRRLGDIRAASSYDVAFLNRDLLEGQPRYERLLLKRNPRVVFDFDDAIFLGQKAAHVEWICKRAAWVTAGNESLADFARQFADRVTVLPTAVDTDTYEVQSATTEGPVRVGWLGSDQSIRETLLPQIPMLARLQAELGFELVVVTKPIPRIPECGLGWTYREWTPQLEAGIASLFDIGIMPLSDTPFQRGKCGCKLLQYMAAGLPAVASPVGINRTLMQDGRHGYLVSSEREWRSALSSLLVDPQLRSRLGTQGRAFVEEHYSVRKWFPVLLDVLLRVSSQPR